MYGMYYLEQKSTPPRTSVQRTIFIRSNRSYGNLFISIAGGNHTELKRAQVNEIITAMQQWLSELVAWSCPQCDAVNEAQKVAQYEYNWLKCPQCKRNIPLEKVGWLA